MPDKNNNLYLFEAIELRNEYDRHISLIENLLTGNRREGFYRSDEEEREPADDFDLNEFRQKLKKLQTKRVKLNQAIQAANFTVTFKFEGEKITLAEALEIRKNLLAEREALSKRVADAAYKRIIHKEERDIIRNTVHSFTQSYEQYKNSLKKLRKLLSEIHILNHKRSVEFKDE